MVGAGRPGDAAGVEQHAEPVVVEVAEPVAGALDALDAPVEAFAGAVGCAGVGVDEDLGAPPGDGAAQGADLGDFVGGAAGDGLVQQDGGLGGIVGEVEVADGLFRRARRRGPRRGHSHEDRGGPLPRAVDPSATRHCPLQREEPVIAMMAEVDNVNLRHQIDIVNPDRSTR